MTEKRSNVYALIVLVALMIIIALTGSGVGYADAAVSYSDVLSDLRKDEQFDVEKYPAVKGDYSLQVIQIAESADAELLVYVYQPGAAAFDYRAVTINIAREPDNSINLDFKSYKLTYLNSVGVFYKYKADGFKVNADTVRYYNISNILRPWDRYLDQGTGNDNTVSEVPYAVGQYWTVTGAGDTVNYSMTTSEVVTIKDKYVGFVNYTDGAKIKWNNISGGSTDAHFVAFSTGKQIDKLISVKMTFTEQPVKCRYCSNPVHVIDHAFNTTFNHTYAESLPHSDYTITYKDKGGNTGGGNIVHADPYAWYRIRTTSEFLSEESNKDYNLTQGTKENLRDTKWVLSFYETQRRIKSDENDVWQVFNPIGWAFVGDYDFRYSKISDVMVLQLEFETAGQTFRLGVVDNKQTGSNVPGNEPTPDNPVNRFKKSLTTGTIVTIVVFTVVIIIVAIVLICIFVPGAAPMIGRGLLKVGKGILWIVLLPFKAVAALFKAIGRVIERRRKATVTAKPENFKKAGKKK